jgi:putative ABC transport system permease protein
MVRQKAYTAINILGLSLGIAASMLIIIYVADELSYDEFIPDVDRMYRVTLHGRMNDNDFNIAVTSGSIAPALLAEVPEVESATRLNMFRTMPVQYEDKTFTESHFLIADKNFLEFFSIKVLQGDPQNALSGVDRVVLPESVAKRYFGDENPLGKILLRGAEKSPMEVSAVIADPPANFHLAYDMILSNEAGQFGFDENWTNNNIYNYFKIHSGADSDKVKVALDGFVQRYVGAELEKFLGISLENFYAAGNKFGFQIQPVQDIHLRSEVNEEIKPGGSIQYLYIFGAIALFIIVLACINFMNLSTARSANRAKEVGVRKAVGAGQTKLILQFLSESLLYSLISTFLAVFIVLMVLEPFNNLSGKDLNLGIFLNPLEILALLVFAVLIGLMAGSYPAFYLTSFTPSTVLKGKVRHGVRRSSLRNGLVVFQFFISISLIISSMVVYKQIKHLQDVNLGFEKENVVNLYHTMSLGQNGKAFKDALMSNSEFVAASYANRLPPNVGWNSVFRNPETAQDFMCTLYIVDEDHLDAMGFKMVDGRFFSKDFVSDSTAIIVNETAFKMMGWAELNGQRLSGFWGNNDEPVEKNIIGVIKDFNFESLHQSVRPLIISLSTVPNYEMAVKLSPGPVGKKLEVLEEIWKKHVNGAPFEFAFVDANFDALFKAEQKMGNIILVFTVLAISIACLGLFGLAAYTTEQRTKEISIRKALGATVPQLVTLLSKDFTLLVLLAFGIAAPLSYYLMNKYWLQNFAYRVDISLFLMVLAGLLSIFIAWLTVSFQSFKAAASNPVDYLRND